ncbi:unnamed protein product [Penicillium olsonii]|uniref:Zn(2)-C6 fungal-type domain-containing protein n=1 Tax=Penicillium olsonii TaxID=99116 RepID=A0A9W4MZV5_PENOL|nr:unnamed protein product [Penicillium olsonii]CAG8201603.1 unnamed protein product [Penicillium olsonii]
MRRRRVNSIEGDCRRSPMPGGVLGRRRGSGDGVLRRACQPSGPRDEPHPTMDGPNSKRPRRRIRPSRARGLRTKTGWERRVKCDDRTPICLRCSKSDRICRYAPSSGQNAAQGIDQEPPGRHGANCVVQPDSDERREDTGANPQGLSDLILSQASTSSLQVSQSSVCTPPCLHVTCVASSTDAPAQSNFPIETSSGEGPNSANQQNTSSLEAAFSTSPLSHSQASLLDISPLEWYDLLARDAISHIQELGETSGRDPRWKFSESTLSRRQSPVPVRSDAGLAEIRRHGGQRQRSPGAQDQAQSPLLDHHRLSQIWNTATQIELSPVDLTFFRYYIEVVGPILDLFDPRRHFSNVVPHLALWNIGLLKSILAVGAKHMSLDSSQTDDGNTPHCHTEPNESSSVSSFPETAPKSMATQYYYETLQYLSQTLLYPAYSESHEILATATMISTYEMFDADSALNSSVWEQHLRGSFWIQRSQDNDGESADGLRQAVWWAWLRQDIWAAFQAGRPTITFWRARKPLEALTSDELATRIVYICGQCVKYASGGTPQGQDPMERIEQGDRLLRTLDDWHGVLPASYQPVTVTRGPGSDTKVSSIWIHPPSHAAAMQMYHFARAIVLLNQPTMGGLNAYMHREKELTKSVETVCGIASSCHESEPAKAFVNVQALFGGNFQHIYPPSFTDPAQVGRFVRSSEMREDLLRLLRKMLKISKFPSKAVLSRLERVWQE